MTNENSTPTIEYSPELSDALAQATTLHERIAKAIDDPNTTPKKLRQLHAMLKFTNEQVETELKDSIPVNKRNATSA